MTTKQHYENHLSHFYSWMFGDFDSMVKKQFDFFSKESILPISSTVALDLGAGSGFQTIALKQLGFDVHAVDFSKVLLDELKEKDSSIKTHLSDISELSNFKTLNPELITCMGDTLTHLSSKSEVKQLLQNCYSLLVDTGKVVLSFRDLSKVMTDVDRFIPVKSDENRILTCFLEDEIDKVKVFDLLHERSGEEWTLSKSFYKKLKLSANWVKLELESVGFKVNLSKLPNGMDVVIAHKN